MALQALRTEPFAESSAERAARIQREAAVSQQAMDPGTQHPPSQPRAKPRQKTDPDDPLHVAMPTLKELESQIRRRSVGGTIAEICADLGVTPPVATSRPEADRALLGFLLGESQVAAA